jgi:hypothetical protein
MVSSRSEHDSLYAASSFAVSAPAFHEMWLPRTTPSPGTAAGGHRHAERPAPRPRHTPFFTSDRSAVSPVTLRIGTQVAFPSASYWYCVLYALEARCQLPRWHRGPAQFGTHRPRRRGTIHKISEISLRLARRLATPHVRFCLPPLILGKSVTARPPGGVFIPEARRQRRESWWNAPCNR